MKKYRIKNFDADGYIVQERMLLFFWSAFTSRSQFDEVKIFETIEDAKDFIKEQIEIKKVKYIEYV